MSHPKKNCVTFNKCPPIQIVSPFCNVVCILAAICWTSICNYETCEVYPVLTFPQCAYSPNTPGCQSLTQFFFGISAWGLTWKAKFLTCQELGFLILRHFWKLFFSWLVNCVDKFCRTRPKFWTCHFGHVQIYCFLDILQSLWETSLFCKWHLRIFSIFFEKTHTKHLKDFVKSFHLSFSNFFQIFLALLTWNIWMFSSLVFIFDGCFLTVSLSATMGKRTTYSFHQGT